MKHIIIYSLLLLVIPTMLLSQNDNEWQNKERKEKMEALKIAYLTNELNLTPEESQQFWPIYNEYQKKLKNLRKESRPNLSMDQLTDAEADQLIEEHFNVEIQKLELLRTTVDRLKPIIGPKRVLKVNSAEQDFREKLLRRAGKKYERKKNKRERFRDDQ